jgi:general secretion pathway protein G
VDSVPDCRAGRLRGVRPGRAFTIIELLAVVVVIGALSAIALPRYHDIVERAKIARAIGDLRALETDIDSQDSLPATLAQIGRGGMLDPWGNPYVYFPFPPTNGHAPPNGARRDRFLVPVNSTYDLYSTGADGKTALAFTANASRDDVVRASDGGYLGLAINY